MPRRIARLATAVSLLGIAAVHAQAPVPQGGEFVVSATGRAPDVAMNASGAFEVVWGETEIRAQRYDAAGVAAGPGIQVNAYTTDAQSTPTVALGDDGSALVFWRSSGQFGGDRIAGRRFTAGGLPDGADFLASALMQYSDDFAAAAANGTGDAVLTWTSGPDPRLRGDIYERQFGRDGMPRAGATLVQTRTNPNTSSDQRDQSVAIDATGAHVVVWGDDGRTTNTSVGDANIAMRRYSAAGAPFSNEQRVNTTLAGEQYDPAVAMNADGAFTVVWYSNGPPGEGVYLQHFDATGARRGGEVRVSTSAVDYLCRPEVVLGQRGDAVVVWVRTDGRLVLRRIDRDGAAASAEVLVGTTQSVTVNLNDKKIAVAASEAGSLVVVWPGTNGGVFGQRFALAPVAGEPAAPAAAALTVAPSPAGPAGATVRYTLAAPGSARVSVLDALGREVAVLADGAAAAGPHDVRLDAGRLAPGVYVVRLAHGGAVESRRLTVVR